MMRVDPEVQEILKRLKVHPNEALNDVVLRLVLTKGPTAEADAFESATDRFEKFLESKREDIREIYRQELRDKIASGKAEADEAARVLGLDGVKGDLPALGLKRKAKG